jgi:hypothetical protein
LVALGRGVLNNSFCSLTPLIFNPTDMFKKKRKCNDRVSCVLEV